MLFRFSLDLMFVLDVLLRTSRLGSCYCLPIPTYVSFPFRFGYPTTVQKAERKADTLGGVSLEGPPEIASYYFLLLQACLILSYSLALSGNR